MVMSILLLLSSMLSAASYKTLQHIDTKKARAIATDGLYTYVADDRGGLKIIDLSKSDSEAIVGTYQEDSVRYFDIEVYDNYAYIAAANDGVEILDISDKTNPYKVASIKVKGFTNTLLYDDGYLYLANKSSGIMIVDVQTPENPQVISSVKTKQAMNLALDNDTLYVADGKNGVLVFDISDKSKPVKISHIKTDDKTRAVLVDNDTLYIATRYAGVTFVDISNPQSATVTDVYATDGKAINIDLKDNLLYISDAKKGMIVLDKDTKKQVERFKTHSKLRDIAFIDNKVLLSCNNGISIIEKTPKKDHNKPVTHVSSMKLLTDSVWKDLSKDDRMMVVHKLFASMYYGVKPEKVMQFVDSETFPSDFQKMFTKSIGQEKLKEIESKLDYFSDYDRGDSGKKQISHILARLYYLEPSKEYLNRWSAYILTQTILFSPAIELNTVLDEDAISVYDNLVLDMDRGVSIPDSTYNHITSQSNWRRFRSPEDNGREMLEIYLMDFDDSHVPLAAKALQNWHLDRKKNLIIGDNENTEPITNLFANKTIYNGYDYYDSLVQDPRFMPTVTRRLVQIYFPNFSEQEQESIVNALLERNPNTWSDLLFDIVMSEKYLLESTRLASFEELFFPIVKSIPWIAKAKSFEILQTKMSYMKQACMRYKLGRPTKVADDTESLAVRHSAMRGFLILNPNGQPDNMTNFDDGISFNTAFPNLPQSLILENEFVNNKKTDLWYEQERVRSQYIIDLYMVLLTGRVATDEEKEQLSDIIDDRLYDKETFKNRRIIDLYSLDSSRTIWSRGQFIYSLFDYISRLSDTYQLKAIKKGEDNE